MKRAICSTCKNCDSCTLPKGSKIFECEEFNDDHLVNSYLQSGVDLRYLVVESSHRAEQPMANMK
jgi:hypothetical protein